MFYLCRERVLIPPEKPCIILKGSGNKTTIVSYGDAPRVDRSTFTSYPPNVVLSGITFVVNTRNIDRLTIRNKWFFFFGKNIRNKHYVLLSKKKTTM